MESITIKVDESLAKEIDKAMKPLYSTKTEFIREAIREKIKTDRQESINQLMILRGSIKGKITDEDIHKNREKILKEFIKEKGWKS